MASTLEQITEAARALPVIDRARLADELVQSLEGESFTEIDKLWTEEAKRRRDEVRSGAVKTVPGPDALRRVREVVPE
jgi:hypothetical protein